MSIEQHHNDISRKTCVGCFREIVPENHRCNCYEIALRRIINRLELIIESKDEYIKDKKESQWR